MLHFISVFTFYKAAVGTFPDLLLQNLNPLKKTSISLVVVKFFVKSHKKANLTGKFWAYFYISPDFCIDDKLEDT